MPEPQHKPLRVLTQKDVERVVLGSPYAPLIDSDKLKTIVAVVMSVAKAEGILIVRADPDEFRSHLKFVTAINWTP
jgi:hypothetical protein